MKRDLQFFDLFTDLRADSGPPDVVVEVLGRTVLGDVGKGLFTYDATNVAVDDNLNTVRPTGFATGAWVRTTSIGFDNSWYFNSSGLIAAPVKVWAGTVSPSTSNGYSIDISSAGFTSILPGGVFIIATKNTSTVTSIPNVAIKTISTTAIVVNIAEANATTTTILGIPVLSGAPNVFANTTGLTLEVLVRGY